MIERRVKCCYLEEEAEADPLVIGVGLLVVGLAPGVVDSRVRDDPTHLLLERRPDRVRGMDPTVSVEDVLGDILGVDAVDGVADVLPSGDDQAESDEDHDGDAVVEPEDGRVDVNVADFDQVFETAEDVEHSS